MGLFRLLFTRKMRSFEGIPGPEPRFPLGNAGDFIRTSTPWELCAEYGQEYGGLTLIWLLHKPALVLNDPKLIGQVLDSDWTDYYKDNPVNALRPVITSGSLFITNRGRGWEQARQDHPLNRVDTDDWLAKQFRPTGDIVANRIVEWAATGRPVDLYDEMQRLCFDGFSQPFFGRTFDRGRYDDFQTLARTGDRRIRWSARLPFLPPPLSLWFYPARRRWYGSFTSLVREARANPKSHGNDLLSLEVRSQSPLSDEALAEALASVYFGGGFSAASTINTALYLLARHPEEHQQLVTALRDELGSAPADYQKLMSCRPLDFVVREAMRFYPAVPLYFRNSSRERPVQLGEHTIPPDTLLFISNWFLHKHSPHWDDAHEFRPSRWDQGVAESHPIGSDFFFPFGRGPRMCIGAPFAQMFIRLALATILLDSEVELDPNQDYVQNFFFGVMMPKGLQATFQGNAV